MNTQEKVINVSCKIQGTLTIPNEYTMNDNFSISGNLADYSVKTPERLQQIASGYDWIERIFSYGVYDEGGSSIQKPNIKRIKGKEYTLVMAKNDFKRFSKDM